MTAVRAPRPARPAARDTAPRRAPRRVAPTARPLPQESAGPRLRVAVRPERAWRTMLVACGVLFFATLVLSVAIQGERIKAQEQADRIEARMAAATERHRDLRVAVAQAESPARILEAARSLGMVEPGPIAAVPAAVPTPTPQDRAG
jgi:cell division protein FtsL